MFKENTNWYDNETHEWIQADYDWSSAPEKSASDSDEFEILIH